MNGDGQNTVDRDRSDKDGTVSIVTRVNPLLHMLIKARAHQAKPNVVTRRPHVDSLGRRTNNKRNGREAVVVRRNGRGCQPSYI